MTISKDIKDREWGKFEDVENKPTVRVYVAKTEDAYTSMNIIRGSCGRVESINYFKNGAYVFTQVFSYDENGNLTGVEKVVGD